jgi:hypothetical protein
MAPCGELSRQAPPINSRHAGEQNQDRWFKNEAERPTIKPSMPLPGEFRPAMWMWVAPSTPSSRSCRYPRDMTVLRDEARFENACHLKAAVATTGAMGGDGGHGGWTEITLTNSEGNCEIEVSTDGGHATDVDQITIRVSGDAEMVVLANALEWAGRRLREFAGDRAKPIDDEADAIWGASGPTT